jgi:sugar O-acyltransferase (sialic acid O-acetyltransferase NeuD family)
VIVGAGGHGQVVADIIRVAGRHAAGRVLGYVDDGWACRATELQGVPVLGPVSALPAVPHDAVIVAIGDNRTRARLTGSLPDEAFWTAVHPASVVCEDAGIGPGSMICAGAIVNTGAVIGRGVILNTACSVDHHNTIGDFVHIAPGARLGGEVTVGEGAFVGIGAVVLPQITIGAWSVIGAGAVVIRDVPDGATVVGNPARPLRKTVGRPA